MKRLAIVALLVCLWLPTGMHAVGFPYLGTLARYGQKAMQTGKSMLGQALVGASIQTALQRLGRYSEKMRPVTNFADDSMNMLLVNSLISGLFSGLYVEDEKNRTRCYKMEDPERYQELLLNSGLYIKDEEEENETRCYKRDDPERYNELQKRYIEFQERYIEFQEQCSKLQKKFAVDPNEAVDGPDFDFDYADRPHVDFGYVAHFAAKDLAIHSLLKKVVVPAAMSFGCFQKVSLLLGRAYLQPGLFGVATTLGANVTRLLALMIITPLLSKFIVKPTLDLSIHVGKKLWQRRPTVVDLGIQRVQRFWKRLPIPSILSTISADFLLSLELSSHL